MLAASRLVADGLLRPSDGLPHKGLVVTGQAVATLLLRAVSYTHLVHSPNLLTGAIVKHEGVHVCR